MSEEIIVRSNGDEDCVVSVIEQYNPSWFSRLLFNKEPSKSLREYYSRTGAVWFELPDMMRCDTEYELWLTSIVDQERAAKRFSLIKEYVR